MTPDTQFKSRFSLIMIALTIAIGVACSASNFSPSEEPTDSALNGSEAATDNLYITIHPIDYQDDSPAFLSQKFAIDDTDYQELTLVQSIDLSGVVTGWYATPWSSVTPPGTADPVPNAYVVFDSPNQPGERMAQTDVLGEYAIDVVPQKEMRVRVHTGDPMIAPISLDIKQSSSADVDLDLGYGITLYGSILDSGGVPLSEFEVQAESADELETASTYTNELGFFQLQVPTGSWRIISKGRDDGRDPIQTSDWYEVSEEAVRIDLVYNNLDLITVGGRVVDNTGNGVSNVSIQFQSTSLHSYKDIAEYSTSVTTNSTGHFDTKVISGLYTINVLAPEASQLSNKSFELMIDDPSETEIEDTVLNDFMDTDLFLEDEDGAPLIDASVLVRETIANGRHWTLYTDNFGNISTQLPMGELQVEITPPGDRLELVLTRLVWDTAESPFLSVVVEAGVLFTGNAFGDYDAEMIPIENAWFEVTDSQNEIIAMGLTQDDGWFEFRVESE